MIVEIGGGQHDRSSPREAERSGFLQNQGYRILRFWNNEVLANIDGVHETIAEELGRGASPIATAASLVFRYVTKLPPAEPATIAAWLRWVFEGSGDLPRCLR